MSKPLSLSYGRQVWQVWQVWQARVRHACTRAFCVRKLPATIPERRLLVAPCVRVRVLAFSEQELPVRSLQVPTERARGESPAIWLSPHVLLAHSSWFPGSTAPFACSSLVHSRHVFADRALRRTHKERFIWDPGIRAAKGESNTRKPGL